MDFVVIGIVIGGVVVLAGVVIRDLGPRMKPWVSRPVPDDVSPQRLAAAWTRYCGAAGSLITTGGLLMVLATVAAVVFEASDAFGMDAVLATGALALSSIALAALVVTPHYRRGGFDGRIAADFREGARPIPAPESRPMADPDDVFALPEAEANEPQPTETPPRVPDHEATEAQVAEDTGLPADEPVSVAEPESETVPVATDSADAPTDLRSTRTYKREDSLEEPSAAFEPWVAAEPEPIPESRVRYDRYAGGRQQSPPAVQPAFPTIDDELPAWNARVESHPQPSGGHEALEPTPIDASGKQPGEAGFQSNLLADLELPEEEPNETPGSFKSRLLNELTASPAPQSGQAAATIDETEPVVDILLDEFSLPEPPASVPRRSNSTR